jgi:hypothetical protein
MSAFKKFDPYAAASKPKEVAPKVAKVPKVARRPACHPEATLGGLGTLGGLAANIAKPWLSLGRPDNIARNRAYPSRWRVLADWTDGLERMRLKTCPITVNPKHWLRLQDVAKRFVELWGEQAAGLGWSALDIFGCHPERPSDRYDCMGLVWMVPDADPQAMGSEIVILRTRSGQLIKLSKSADVRERILIWDLAPGGIDFSETTP